MGHAYTQDLQPIHFNLSTLTIPVLGSLIIAFGSTGQAASQAGYSQWVQ